MDNEHEHGYGLGNPAGNNDNENSEGLARNDRMMEYLEQSPRDRPLE